MIGGEGGGQPGASGSVGQTAKAEARPTIQVKTLTVESKANAPKNENDQAAATNKAGETTKKDESKSQSKENFERERRFVDAFAINLIKNAKLNLTVQDSSTPEATLVRQDLKAEQIKSYEKTRQALLDKLSFGGQLDKADKDFMGMFEYQFPPKNIIAKEGFDPIFEPRLSLLHLLDYYNQLDPKTVAEKGPPTLTPEVRKQLVTAATHLGLITTDGEGGKFGETTSNIVKDIFKDSDLTNEKLTEITKKAEDAISGRLILTSSDFNKDTGFLSEITNSIKDIQDLINLEKQAGRDTKKISNELSILLENKDVFAKYLEEAMQGVGVDYQKLVKGQLNEKATEEWFSIFGPQVAGVDQTTAINKYFGKHDLLGTLKKNRIITLTKGGGMMAGLMSVLTAYGIYQTMNKKEGAMMG